MVGEHTQKPGYSSEYHNISVTLTSRRMLDGHQQVRAGDSRNVIPVQTSLIFCDAVVSDKMEKLPGD